MAEEEKQKLVQCYHCGNKGLQIIVGTYTCDFGGPILDEVGNVQDWEIDEQIKFYLLSCPVCELVTLYRQYVSEIEETHTIVYPYSAFNHDGVPEHIKSAFESALRVKGIDTAICLLSLRRTLEAVCKDKKATGRTLEEMVKDMIEKNILPNTLDDACWIIRQLGNEAAHTSKTTFHQFEVNQVVGFVETIIDYLYALPQRINRMKIRITERNNEE